MGDNYEIEQSKLDWFVLRTSAVERACSFRGLDDPSHWRPTARFNWRSNSAGAKAAVEDINASLILRDKLMLAWLDDRCDPKEAARGANVLVNNDHATMVIGHSCPTASLVASEIYRDAHVIQIDPVTTDPHLTESVRGRRDSMLFRISERQDRAAKIAVIVLRDELKNKKISFIAGGVQKAWVDSFKSQIGTGVVSTEVVETIPTGGSSNNVSLLYDPYNQNWPIPNIPGRVLYSVGGADIGIATSARNREVIQKLSRAAKEAKYSIPISPAINAYAAVQIWANAVSAARSSVPDRVAEQMRRLTFDTIRGSVAFDEVGDVRQPLITIVRYGTGPIIQVPNMCNEDKCKNCACSGCCPK